MMSEDCVSKEDIDVLKGLARDKEAAARTVEVANMQSQSVDLLYENTLLKIYLKYGLSSSDGFDKETGQIIRGDKENENEGTETEDTEGTS
jgi:hypothetical protein